MSKEAMKLEALENSRSLEPVDVQWVKGKRHAAITALRKALAEQPAQQALDKMAENARELGIQMQPEEPRAWFTVDELNAWADKKLKENPHWAEQPAQQEAQAEETVKERTPQERRDAGEWHCPECFTFGHQHRQGCTAAHGIKENT